MFTSDTEKHKPSSKKSAIVFFGFAVFCFFFGRIYDHFGHGVHSFCMSFLFIPALAAALMYFVFAMISYIPPAISRNLFDAGIGTLTAWSLLTGIFEIAGTSSEYVKYFLIFGILFVSAAVTLAVCDLFLGANGKSRQDYEIK